MTFDIVRPPCCGAESPGASCRGPHLLVAYLDRANVGFAKLRMARDLRFSDEIFGLGIGIFFLGYLTLEIPGAHLVTRRSLSLTEEAFGGGASRLAVSRKSIVWPVESTAR
jgi:hypothetical protein